MIKNKNKIKIKPFLKNALLPRYPPVRIFSLKCYILQTIEDILIKLGILFKVVIQHF